MSSVPCPAERRCSPEKDGIFSSGNTFFKDSGLVYSPACFPLRNPEPESLFSALFVFLL